MQSDRTLAKANWKMLEDRKKDVADTFYRSFFEVSPEFKALFDAYDKERHYLIFDHMVNLCIEGKGYLKSLKPTVEELGRQHAQLGVNPMMYMPMERALLKALEVHLEDSFTPECRSAWSTLYRTVASLMIKGSIEERH